MSGKGGAAIRGSIDLRGAKELISKLKTLEPRIERKLLRQALRAGAKVIQAEAQARVPVKTGRGRKGIKVRAMSRMKRGTVGVKVQTSEGDYQGDEFYLSFIERGYFKQPVARDARTGRFISLSKSEAAKQGLEPVFHPPRPFMRPAFETKKDEASQVITDKLKQGIESEARKSA